MAVSRSALKLNQVLLKNALFSNKIQPRVLIPARWGSGQPEPWNYVWAPSTKIPQTKEELAKAAKKYGIIEEDYKPCGTDVRTGCNYGDYPQVDLRSYDHRPGHYNYDYPHLKRNFGEPLHHDQHWYEGIRCDTTPRIVTPFQHFLYFLAIMGTLIFLRLAFPEYRWPMSERQLTTNGKTYYTFEKAD